MKSAYPIEKSIAPNTTLTMGGGGGGGVEVNQLLDNYKDCARQIKLLD